MLPTPELIPVCLVFMELIRRVNVVRKGCDPTKEVEYGIVLISLPFPTPSVCLNGVL